jgi:hypothetical protein
VECADWRRPHKARALSAYSAGRALAWRNYGDRYRHGEPITSSFVESAVNQVVSKRFVKRQQMAWRPAHAHGLLQVRTAVLNEQLRSCFERWYPALAAQRSCSPYRSVEPLPWLGLPTRRVCNRHCTACHDNAGRSATYMEGSLTVDSLAISNASVLMHLGAAQPK